MSAWTDDGRTWPPPPGGIISSYLEAIRLAIMERFNQASMTAPDAANFGALLHTGIFPPGYRYNRSFPFDYLANLHAGVTNLMPYYFNQTSGGGSWDGEATLPTWNEADALAAIGDASRLPVPVPTAGDLTPGLSAWADQQRRLLNRLLWTEGAKSSTFESRQAIRAGITDGDIDIAWANMIASSYSAPAPVGTSGLVSASYTARGGVFSTAAQVKLTTATSTQAEYSEADVYLYAIPHDGGGSDIYDDQSAGYTEGVFNLLASLAPATNHACAVTPPTSPAPVYPAPGWSRGWSWTIHFVRKFDVPGGFSFTD